MQKLPGELTALVAGAIPEPLEVRKLFSADSFVKLPGELRGWLDVFRLIAIVLASLVLDLVRFVRFEDFLLPLAQHLHEGFKRWAQATNLAGVKVYRPRQLLGGQAPRIAVEKQVLEGGRNHIRRGRGRAGELGRIEFLVGVDHAAQVVTVVHG